MKLKILALVAAAAALGFVIPQQTPKSTAAAYGALADTILAVKRTESEFVRSLLAGHLRAARDFSGRGDSEHAAAEIALFANEGDNAIGGVRKRLLEGGHHHNADGEAKGIYEPGFVIVTRKAKEEALAVSATMRQAKTDADRKQAWDRFVAIANPLVHEE
jgi:hypothetical protein